MRKQAAVNRAFSVGGSTDRVVLFNWGSSDEARLQNVARVDRHGNVVWRADLPGNAANDCFVSLEAQGELFVARTYSRQVACFDEYGMQWREGLGAAHG